MASTLRSVLRRRDDPVASIDSRRPIWYIDQRRSSVHGDSHSKPSGSPGSAVRRRRAARKGWTHQDRPPAAQTAGTPEDQTAPSDIDTRLPGLRVLDAQQWRPDPAAHRCGIEAALLDAVLPAVRRQAEQPLGTEFYRARPGREGAVKWESDMPDDDETSEFFEDHETYYQVPFAGEHPRRICEDRPLLAWPSFHPTPGARRAPRSRRQHLPALTITGVTLECGGLVPFEGCATRWRGRPRGDLSFREGPPHQSRPGSRPVDG